MTSALYETLGRLAYRITDRIYAKQLLQRLEKVDSATVEVICFANVFSVARCVTRLDVSLTCHAVSRILRDFLRDRLHCISGLSDGHKCLLG